MNILLFIIVLSISFVVVRIGAIAFEMTGLEWNTAKFQALSCFSGTGFTTRESETIVSHPQRRKIASILIVLGNAGLVTLIATFANSIRTTDLINKFQIPFLKLFIPSFLLPWMNLVIIIFSVYFMFKVFTNKRIITNLTNRLKIIIVKKDIIKPLSFKELVFLAKGYGVSRVIITEKNPLIDQSLRTSGLKSKDIIVLAIERKGKTIPNPPVNEKILLNDNLLCFGKLKNIKEYLYEEK